MIDKTYSLKYQSVVTVSVSPTGVEPITFMGFWTVQQTYIKAHLTGNYMAQRAQCPTMQLLITKLLPTGSISLNIFCFYTPVWKTDVLCRSNVRPSICPDVRLSVHVFRTFLQHALRYQFETWYKHSVGGTTCRVWVAPQLGHFDLVYSQK